MASYNELNALIDAYINRNGVQAITGQILNGVLKAMVEQLGRGYTIMGAAIPTTDPGTPDGPECYFASETGTYTDFDGLQIVPGELALLCYTPSDGWTKETIYEGFQAVQATIDGNVGTPSVGVSYAGGVLSFDFHDMKGNPGQNGQDGAAAGFGTIGADITGGVGTPGVTVESSGPATAKNLQFHFTNLKGETGVTSVVATVDNTTGTPTCTVSLVGQQLTLAFSGLKGAQGDTGSSVDYPFTIVNNLTTDDATQALSAAQGVVLDGKVSQLEAKVTDIDKGTLYGNKLIKELYLPGATLSDIKKMRYVFASQSGTKYENKILFLDASNNQLVIAFYEPYSSLAECAAHWPGTKLGSYDGNYIVACFDGVLNDISTTQTKDYAVSLGNNCLSLAGNPCIEMFLAYQNLTYQLPTITKNVGYITMDGQKATSWANGRCSDPIPVRKGDMVTVVSTANNNTVAILSLTDENETFYTPIYAYSGVDNDTYRYLCDADGYIIISGHKNYTMSAAISSVPINSFIMDYIVTHQLTTPVLYSPQTLTDSEKGQARTNIGAGSASDVVRNATDISSLNLSVAQINQVISTLGMNRFIQVNSLPTASSTTEGIVYLVPDGNGEYDRYITVEDGEGGYDWVPVGSTDVDMSAYASKQDAININNVALVPRKVMPKPIASVKITPSDWTADSDGAIDSNLHYIWDESYQVTRPCVRGYNVNARSKFYQALPVAVDMTDKALAVSIYIRENIEETQLKQILVGLYSDNSVTSSHRAAFVVQQGYNAMYDGIFRTGWFHFCINPKECLDSAFTGGSFDITNVTHIVVIPGNDTADTTNNDIYIADISIYNKMRRGGVVLLIDNFAPSVVDMWKYAASKGVDKMNLSIVPNWIGTSASATLTEIQDARDAGCLVINHTFNHKTTVVDNNEIADEITFAEDWMNRNGCARGSKIVSVPSAYFPTDKYKAYVASNAQMIYHNWLPQLQEDNSISNPKYYVNYPFYPNTRFLNISGLDQNAMNNTRVDYLIETARRAIADKGYAVLGFHATAWDVDGGVLWKSFIDQLVALDGISFFGVDELLEGELY